MQRPSEVGSVASKYLRSDPKDGEALLQAVDKNDPITTR